MIALEREREPSALPEECPNAYGGWRTMPTGCPDLPPTADDFTGLRFDLSRMGFQAVYHGVPVGIATEAALALRALHSYMSECRCDALDGGIPVVMGEHTAWLRLEVAS